ncbi:MAG: Hsp33 family molecular chaperone HslO [Alphaproteobacteria bacterium]
MLPPPSLDPAQRGDAGDDLAQPFQIDGAGLRGRLIRLGPSVDAILRRHDYPAPVARLLGEAMALAACLASSLKYEGIFTLQARGEGALRFLVTDVTSAGHMRGYAGFDRSGIEAILADEPEPTAARLFSGGHLAFTVDQGRDAQLYQGIVPLEGVSLAESVHHYFRQSEQIDTAIKAVCAPAAADAGGWRAAALMVQRLPGSSVPDADGLTPAEAREASDDGWRRAVLLMGSATAAEMLDPGLDANTLLYRLFHEDGVRVFAPRMLEERCRCGTRERIAGILASLPRDQVADLRLDDGSVTVTCEFCRREERFDEADLVRLHET